MRRLRWKAITAVVGLVGERHQDELRCRRELERPGPRHNLEAHGVSGSSPAQQHALSKELAGMADDDAQQILDELTGRMNAAHVRDPVRYSPGSLNDSNAERFAWNWATKWQSVGTMNDNATQRRQRNRARR
jgi:hypothetical protein